MTCIVGFKHNNKLVLAGDYMASNLWTSNHVSRSKIVKKNPHVAFGYCGSFKLGQLLEHSWSPPIFAHDANLDTYIYSDLPASIRNLAKTNELDDKGLMNGSLIFLVMGRLFSIQSDYSVLEYDNPIYTIGSGKWPARSVIYLSLKYKTSKLETILDNTFDAVSFVTQSTVSPTYSYITMEVGSDKCGELIVK
jgi:ATP-dependent protease HslVU (ClpYQ) peptidase subunit